LDDTTTLSLKKAPKIILLLAMALSVTSAALAISAIRIYLYAIPTTATVVRVETRDQVVANPITEKDMLNPSAAQTVRRHDVYVEIPELTGRKEALLLASTSSPAPAIGERMKVRYRGGDGELIEIFPHEAQSLFTPAVLSGLLALVTFSLYGASITKPRD
jgi:hypothetical protein